MDASLRFVGGAGGERRFASLTKSVVEALPAAVCVCSSSGYLTLFNQRAAELWGRVPRMQPRQHRFCGAAKLFEMDGAVLPHDRSPMAIALRTGQAQRNQKVVVERPDGSRIATLMNVDLLEDEDGAIGGAINCFNDVSDLVYGTIEVDEAERERLLCTSIVKSSDDAIVSKDLDGVITSWNRGAERLFGYTGEEVIGRPVTILMPPEQQKEEPAILRRIARGARIENFETVRRHKDGHLIDVSLTISPVKDRAGRIIGASKIARDITERKRFEAQLARRVNEQTALYQFTAALHRTRSVDETYAAALDAILAALRCQRASILRFDQTGMMRFVASRGLSAFYKEKVDGHSPWSIEVSDPSPICIPDVSAAELPLSLRDVIQREGIGALAFIPLVVEGELIGKFMAYYDQAHEFEAEEIDVALTIARQLAFSIERQQAEKDRRRAEQALRDSERRLEFALSAGRMGAWQWDMTTNAVIWSPGLEHIHGLAPGEFGGRFEDFERDIYPDDRDRVACEIQQAIAEQSDYHTIYRIIRPDGAVRWLEAFGRMSVDDSGAPSGLAGVCTDVTERKENELQRDLLLAELSHRVKNTLATIISIEQQSFLNAPSVEAGRRSFVERVKSLAQSHGRLAEGNWTGVSLRSIFDEELAPYRRPDGSNVTFHGPPTLLKPRSALSLGMAVHELTTNAAKHGALSSPHGSVEARWSRDDADTLIIHWHETGGPTVTPPQRTGFGRLLIERALASDLRSEVELDFRATGLRCTIKLPISENVVRD